MMEESNIDLSFVQKQFFCCTTLNKFNWNNSTNGIAMRIGVMNPEIQREILGKTVNHDLVKNYPIKKSYQRAFLKLLINELEKNCQEIEDDMYNTYCSLVSSDDEQSSSQYRHFLYENNGSTDVITIQESVNIVSLGTTGLCTWQAGLGLAEWCILNRELLTGKKVLELGCGVGLTGLSIIRSCRPKEYIFSDVHPSVLNMLQNNILINLKPDELNSINNYESKERTEILCSEINYDGVKVKAIRLPWDEINEFSNTNSKSHQNSHPNVVLAADVLYDDSCFDSLAKALHNLLRVNGTYGVIAATIRNTDTIEKFINITGSYDLVFEEMKIPERKLFIHTDDTPIRIMKIINSAEKNSDLATKF